MKIKNTKFFIIAVLVLGLITVALILSGQIVPYRPAEQADQSAEQIAQTPTAKTPPEKEPPLEQKELVPEPPESADALMFSGFEDETTQNWEARMGSEQLSVTNEAAKSGRFSLKTTGREAAFNGPDLNVIDIMRPNERYEISVWVKLLPGQNPAQMVLSAQRTQAGSQNFDNIVRGVAANSEDWVQLKGTYQFAEGVEGLDLYVETIDGTASFYIDEFMVRHLVAKAVQEDIPALKDVFADMFTIGAAVEPKHLAGVHAQMLEKHYNLLVAENVMKPESIQPIEGTFNFTNADRIRDFARDKDMELRFHTLVWHNQVPDWFFIDKEGNRMVDETDPAKREQNKKLLLNRQETHIRTIVERYRDDVDYWEVVNEVIDPAQSNGMRQSEWYLISGKEFIKTAFRVTREAAGEDAMLSINDYNTHQPRKRDFLYDLVMELRDEGIRVDIIGHQTHINIEYPSMALIGESIEKFAEAGFKNHITELDISVYAYGDRASAYNVVPEHLLDRLTIRYRDLFDILRNLEAYIDDVTFWGIGDDHTWLHNRPVPRRDAPFLFDEKLQAKDAFWAVVDPDWEP